MKFTIHGLGTERPAHSIRQAEAAAPSVYEPATDDEEAATLPTDADESPFEDTSDETAADAAPGDEPPGGVVERDADPILLDGRGFHHRSGPDHIQTA